DDLGHNRVKCAEGTYPCRASWRGRQCRDGHGGGSWWRSCLTSAPSRWPAEVSGQMAAMASDTVLELDRLSVAYYREPVVRNLSLTVGHGEIVALLGANGAGKTTTLRAISGLLKPAGGAVRLDGQDLEGVSPTDRARLGLAHVPHDRGIFFGLTVAEH